MFFLKREIRRMSGALQRIVATDTNALLTVGTSDKEIAALARNINAMLERSRRGLHEKDRAEAALKRAVTNISHDLRTPLTAALGYLQLLDRRDTQPDERERYAEIIRGRLGALSLLMNNLFEFARVTEGNMALDLQRVNVCNLLRDVLSENYTELSGFEIDASIPDAPVFCLCDEDSLRRVLQNLIKNAYTHGREYLRVRLDGGTMEISNKADGLDDLDVVSIFERFYTSDVSRTSKNTGLGLAISKELTERMGGSISARAENDMIFMRVTLPP